MPNIDIPRVAGVPALSSYAVVEDAVLLTADAARVLQLLQPPQWGIFDQSGNPYLVGDTVKAVDFDQEYRPSNYPVEDGGFASYNKVARPFMLEITFTKAGNVAERAAFLATIDAAIKSLYLFVVATPERVYQNVNITRQAFRRTRQNGATMLTVEVWCEEIRQSQNLQFSSVPPTAPPGTVPATGGTGAAAPPQNALDASSQPWGQVRSATAADQQNLGTIQASSVGTVVGSSIPFPSPIQ